MNLDIVLIDFLTPEGVLTTYKVKPKHHPRGLTADYLQDIYPKRFGDDDVDLGGIRIYNAYNCSMDKHSARIRTFSLDESEHRLSFQFEHMGVPIGPSREAHAGIYNFVLSPGWRLRDIRVVDPYDQAHDAIREKKQFHYRLFWDPECQTSMLDMQMRSGRGSFSFIVAGTASLTAVDPQGVDYVESNEVPGGVADLTRTRLLDDEGERRLAEELARKANWLELKPNIFGLGVNLNQIIRDCVGSFQRKVRRRRGEQR